MLDNKVPVPGQVLVTLDERLESRILFRAIMHVSSQQDLVVAQADGVSLLERIYRDPDFNSTFATWRAVLPRQGEFMTPESMSDQEIQMLQGTDLVSHVPDIK